MIIGMVCCLSFVGAGCRLFVDTGGQYMSWYYVSWHPTDRLEKERRLEHHCEDVNVLLTVGCTGTTQPGWGSSELVLEIKNQSDESFQLIWDDVFVYGADSSKLKPTKTSANAVAYGAGEVLLLKKHKKTTILFCFGEEVYLGYKQRGYTQYEGGYIATTSGDTICEIPSVYSFELVKNE